MTSSFDFIPEKTKIIIALSGGVDSSVAALLLKQQGFQVEALFMKNWEEDDTETYCAAAQDAQDAQAVCDRLNIKLHTANFSSEYWDNVFVHFLEEYQAGRTPNPDILCNREIKFKVGMQYAKQLGADYFATGHYAQIQKQNDEFFLSQSVDQNKDQTYFLYTLNQTILAKTLFPIGHLPKPQIRAIALKEKLITANKKDSVGICFIGEKRFKNFLSHYLPAQPGNIETTDGTVIGQHEGLMYYTLGQRQGLGIGGQKHSNGKPWYVISKDLQRKVLIVGQGHEHPALLSTRLICENVHWIGKQEPLFPLQCVAKTRYRQMAQACRVEKISESSYVVLFDAPQWAVTPGQSIVFYQANTCMGGGIIIDTPGKSFT